MAKRRVGIRNGALFNQTSTLWNNLLAYYTGDGTPDDALGNYNGTLVNGVTYGTGKISQGFSFDGVNDYVDLGNNLDFDGSTPFSISTWVYINTSKQQAIISKESAGGNYTGYIAQIQSSNQVLFYFGSNYGGGDYLSCQTTNTLTTNTWQMVTITYDGSKSVAGINIFLNGVSSTLSIFRNTLVGSTSNSINTNIGAAVSSGAARYFNGLLDEVGIWDRVLTPSEVTELYNSGNGKQYTPPVVSTPSIITDGLVLNLDAGNTLSYPGTGTDWFDLTSNNNDGVLTNGVSYLTDNGGVMSFDGVNDYVDMGSIETINTNNPFTIEIWSDSNNPSGYPTLLSLKNDGQNWFLFYSPTQMKFGSPTSWYKGAYNTTTNDLKQLHQWVITYSGLGSNTSTNFKMYKDGIEVLLSNGSVSSVNYTNTYIGRFSSTSYMHDKDISNVKIYNKTLTDSEVLQNYNATKGRFGL